MLLLTFTDVLGLIENGLRAVAGVKGCTSVTEVTPSVLPSLSCCDDLEEVPTIECIVEK